MERDKWICKELKAGGTKERKGEPISRAKLQTLEQTHTTKTQQYTLVHNAGTDGELNGCKMKTKNWPDYCLFKDCNQEIELLYLTK